MDVLGWESAKRYKEIFYDKADGMAKITINRPEKRNAFSPLTVQEMQDALQNARMDPEIGVIILTGQGLLPAPLYLLHVQGQFYLQSVHICLNPLSITPRFFNYIHLHF